MFRVIVSHDAPIDSAYSALLTSFGDPNGSCPSADIQGVHVNSTVVRDKANDEDV